MSTITLGKKTLQKNIISSFGLRGVSIICTYIMVPLLIGYLDSYRYGIWMTIFSMINWFQFFDIGLGNGLRNKFAEAIAVNDKELAKMYVSTAYFLISIITLVLFVVFFASFVFVNWYAVFNVQPSEVSELNTIILITFGMQIVNFPLKLIQSVLLGAQKAAMGYSSGTISNILSLVAIFFLRHFMIGNSLLNVAIIYTFINSLIWLIITVYYFLTDFKDVRPSVKYIRRQYMKGLTGLGVKFFILQINTLVLISATPLIIAHILGQTEVTRYNVMFRLYNIPYMIYFITLTPFWNAFTSSYAKNNIDWIRKKLLVLVQIWGGLIVFLALLLIFNKPLFKFWVGDKVIPSLTSGVYLSIYTIVMMLLLPFNFFINGIGKIKLQLYVSCIVTVLNIPLSILLGGTFKMGLDGIIIANIVCTAPLVIFMAIQTGKILNKKATGIWMA